MAFSVNGAAARGVISARALALVGTSIGCSLLLPLPAFAQNISSTANTTDYSLTNPGTISGGPRTVDVATSSGDITLDLGTVITANDGTTTARGAGIAAVNTGPGAVSITDGTVTATGAGTTYAVDAETTTGVITINNMGVVNASGSNADRAIYALSSAGDIAITSNEADGQRYGIYTNAGGTTTINSTTATANGTGLVNAIIGQGYSVDITSGTASVTNAAGNEGTAIFANSDVGGVTVNAQTTNAYGQDQAAMQIFSEGAVNVTSGSILTTQNSDGLSIASGTELTAKSTSITTQGDGARGIVLGANAGGGGFNSGADGIAYTSAVIGSGTISTAGANAYGVYATPNGAGTTSITSDTITTTGAGATGINVAPIGAGAISGAITIASGMISATGEGAGGISVSGSTGAVDITSGKVTVADGTGILAYAGPTSITSTEVDTTRGYGIDAEGTGLVSVASGTVANSGTSGTAIIAEGDSVNVSSQTITGGNIGITANANTGDLTIASGTIALTAAAVGQDSTNAYGIDGIDQGTGTLSITSGSIAITGTGNSFGINAQHVGTSGAVDITSGSISVTGNGGYGIVAAGLAADVTVDSTGNITTTGTTRSPGGSTAAADQRYADGIDANSQTGMINVFNEGVISTAGTTARGIDVEAGRAITTFGAGGMTASTAALTVTNSGTVETAGANANAINILADANAVTVNNGGTLQTSGANSAGLSISDGTGSATIANNGAISTSGTGSYGIALTPTSGTTTISGTGTIETTGDYSHGIYLSPGATAFTGATSITTGPITTSGANAIGIYAVNGSGAITIDASDIRTTGANASAIVVTPVSGSTGAITVDAGIVRVAETTAPAINLASNGIAGPITVSVADSISAGAAVDARSAGAVSVTGGTVQVTGGSNTFGLNAISSGDSATIASTNLTVADGRGIFAQGAASTSVTSGALTTTGADYDYALIAQNVAATGVAPGTVTVDSTSLTSGAGGISTSGGAAATTIGSGTATSAGTDTNAIYAGSTSGTITINAGSTTASGLGARGITAQSDTGNIAITATNVTTTGDFDAANNYSSDALVAFTTTTGPGAITINAGSTSAASLYASAIYAQGGGAVSITSGTASAAGNYTDAIGGVSGTSDVTIDAGSTSATGTGAVAIEADANTGNATINAGTATATGGTAILVNAGQIASVTATSASGGGDGASGVSATGGTGVVLDIGSASSNGTAVSSTNSNTGVTTTTRADAVFAQATTGTINATIGSATATGAGSDAVHLVADGAGGAVNASITGTVSSASGNGLFIDPPGAVSVNVAAGASVSGGASGIDATGATNAITNLGSVTSAGGPAVLASGTTNLVNGGTLSGADGVAVQLGATDDTVTLTTGSSVSGRILGGGGTDAAILSGTNTSATGTQTIAGFTGFDSLTVQSGYWTAQAANASSFNTATVDGGASLELANGAAGVAGVTVPNIVDNGTLVVRSSAASAGSTFGAMTVSGSGAVAFTGTGIVTLDGTNSIATTGPISVDGGSTLLVTGTQGGQVLVGSAGTVAVGNGGTTGTLTGSVVDNGTLVVDRSDDTTFGAALTGTGNFVKQGSGEVTFGTDYGFTGTTTIQQGAIKLSTPVATTTEVDLEGAGELDLSGTNQQIAQLSGTSSAASINIAGGSLTVDQAGTTSFAGSIVGDGSLIKTGSGSLDLTGNSTYTGPTTIDEGRLAVNGSIVSAVTVNSGGILGGNGSVGSVTIGSGGTYAPGNSIGRQTVNGNVTFAAGSIYEVQTNAAGHADRIDATGAATLNGGTVEVLPAAGTYAKLTDYTILTAAGGVTGKFANVTSSMAFLSPLLTYSADTVSLTLARNDLAFGAVAGNQREQAVANAIAARGLGDPIYNGVLFESAADAQRTFNQLSGEIHASLPSELADSDRRIRDAIVGHLTPEDGLGVWGQGLQSYAFSRPQAGLDRIQSNRTGGLGGVDYARNGITLGVNGGYLDDEVRISAAASHAQVTMKFAGANASIDRGPLTARIGGTYAWQHIDTDRVITAPGFGGTLSAAPRANSAQVFGEVGYALTGGPVKLTPFVGDAYNWTRVKAFTETGGIGALSVARDSRSTDFLAAGIRMTGAAPVTATVALLPKVTVSYQHGFGDLDGSSVAQIAGSGPSFDVTGVRLGRNTLNVETGFDLQIGQRLTIGGSGFASTSSEWSDYGAKASIGFRF